MSKIEQVVVQKNYEQSLLTACLFFWTPEFERPERYTSIKILLNTPLPIFEMLVRQNSFLKLVSAIFLKYIIHLI